MEYLFVGSYKIKGKWISFFIISVFGIVNYKGYIIKKGVLKFKIKSLINGYKSWEVY